MSVLRGGVRVGFEWVLRVLTGLGFWARVEYVASGQVGDRL